MNITIGRIEHIQANGKEGFEEAEKIMLECFDNAERNYTTIIKDYDGRWKFKCNEQIIDTEMRIEATKNWRVEHYNVAEMVNMIFDIGLLKECELLFVLNIENKIDVWGVREPQ